MSKNKAKRMPKDLYEAELERLQVQLVSMQQWLTSSGARVLVIFEGRDAAGKGGAIKRIVQYLNPRQARIVALPVPSERERGQWYFQRYIERLPTSGEMVLMDRSWYNRAGVERVLGYCTDDEYERFLNQAPDVERMLVDDGIILIKFWFSVSDKEQQRRFAKRLKDPMRRWKLSDTDLLSITKWEDYSRAKDAMFERTDTVFAPWWTIDSDDKRAARLNAIHHLLSQVPYEHVEPEPVKIPKRPKADDYERPPIDVQRFVHNHAEAVRSESERSESERSESERSGSERSGSAA